MKVTISFRHLEHTEGLDQKIQEKTLHLKKYIHPDSEISWICWVEQSRHYAEIQVLGHHLFVQAKSCEDSLYKCLDSAIEKIEKQLIKQRSKQRERIHKKVSSPQFLIPEDAWTNKGEDWDADLEEQTYPKKRRVA